MLKVSSDLSILKYKYLFQGKFLGASLLKENNQISLQILTPYKYSIYCSDLSESIFDMLNVLIDIKDLSCGFADIKGEILRKAEFETVKELFDDLFFYSESNLAHFQLCTSDESVQMIQFEIAESADCIHFRFFLTEAKEKECAFLDFNGQFDWKLSDKDGNQIDCQNVLDELEYFYSSSFLSEENRKIIERKHLFNIKNSRGYLTNMFSKCWLFEELKKGNNFTEEETDRIGALPRPVWVRIESINYDDFNNVISVDIKGVIKSRDLINENLIYWWVPSDDPYANLVDISHEIYNSTTPARLDLILHYYFNLLKPNDVYDRCLLEDLKVIFESANNINPEVITNFFEQIEISSMKKMITWI